MEAAKGWNTVTVVIALVLCITSMSVTWHCISEVARLQSRVERLEAEDKDSSVFQILSQLGLQTPVHQGDNTEGDIRGHQREVRQFDLNTIVLEIVRAELEAHLNCSTDEDTKCTIEPGPKGDPGSPGLPGPQGEKGDEGAKGNRGEQGQQGHTGFKGEKGGMGDQGLQGGRGERGEKGDMGTRGSVGEKGERGDTGPVGAKGQKGHVGFTGFKGQKGEVGDRGKQGAIGERGEKGEVGPQGPSGGEKGERGDTGPMGPMGEKGQLGYPGYKGQKGEVGKQGLQGNPGPKGEQGDMHQVTDSYICGGTTGWARMAYLDMTNTSHQCLGSMIEVTLSGKRLCGRGVPRSPSCVSATFSTNGLQYSHVCGRITGYQYGRPDGFGSSPGMTLESYYVDGVSMTHGLPGRREHIWTFATGRSEMASDGSSAVCPCTSNARSAEMVPSFVGQHYFCESGCRTRGESTQLYTDDPLWDGDGCSVAGNTCCEFNNPPYFTRHLTNSTSNDLEVRACGYFGPINYSEDTMIELIELYIK